MRTTLSIFGLHADHDTHNTLRKYPHFLLSSIGAGVHGSATRFPLFLATTHLPSLVIHDSNTAYVRISFFFYEPSFSSGLWVFLYKITSYDYGGKCAVFDFSIAQGVIGSHPLHLISFDNLHNSRLLGGTSGQVSAFFHIIWCFLPAKGARALFYHEFTT